MRKILLAIIALSLIPTSSVLAKDKCMNADDYSECMKKESAKKVCLEAADYVGCMNYETGKTTIKNNVNRTRKLTRKQERLLKLADEFNKDKDCSNKNVCFGTGLEKDIFDLPTFPETFYLQLPEDRIVTYYSMYAKDVKVKGEYGRYIDITYIKRYYQNPESGTSGYTSTIGSGTVNCSGYGSSINCTSTPPTTINIPGRAATPGGNVQNKSNLIIDCKDRTTIQWFEGKKKLGKWIPVDAFENMLADMNCPYAGTGKLVKSDFTKYEKRGIRKRNSRIRLPNDD